MRVPPATCVVLALFFVPTSLSQGRASNAWVPSSVGAESLLTPLVGTWHFDMYSADRHDPVTSGQREMRLMSDSTKLAWTETFRGRSDIGTGILGYNAATNAYYVLGVYTHEPNPVVLTGRADPSTRSITFDPAPTNPGLAKAGIFEASTLRLIDANDFEWVASDGSWRTVFSRARGS